MRRADPAPEPAEVSTTRVRTVDWTPWRLAALYVVATRVGFMVAAYAATMLFAATREPTDGFLDIWARWDANHFLIAAESGWSGDAAIAARTAAFFPLYPLLIRALDGIGLNPILAGLLISTAATIIACAFLIKLGDADDGPGAGRRASLYLLFFPTAVFLIAPYSEALFLAGAIPAFHFARAGRWTAAALPAAVAMGTRFAGIFLLIGLAVELGRQLTRSAAATRSRLAATGMVTLAIGVLPALLFALHLKSARGSLWQYRIDQVEGWGRNFVTPLQSFLATWNTRVGSYDSNWIFAWRIEIIAALAGLALVVWALAKKEWGYAAYMGTFLAALITSSWYFSIPRMLLTFFPAMLFLAAATGGDERRHEGVLLVMAPIAVMGTIVFTRGAWFF